MKPYKFNDDLYQSANKKPVSTPILIMQGVAVMTMFLTAVFLAHFL